MLLTGAPSARRPPTAHSSPSPNRPRIVGRRQTPRRPRDQRWRPRHRPVPDPGRDRAVHDEAPSADAGLARDPSRSTSCSSGSHRIPWSRSIGRWPSRWCTARRPARRPVDARRRRPHARAPPPRVRARTCSRWPVSTARPRRVRSTRRSTTSIPERRYLESRAHGRDRRAVARRLISRVRRRLQHGELPCSTATSIVRARSSTRVGPRDRSVYVASASNVSPSCAPCQMERAPCSSRASPSISTS